MNKFLDGLYERASRQNKTIALAEGFDKRAVKAAELLTKRGIAKVVLIGDADEIAKNNPEIDLTGVKIVNPKTCEKTKEYANLLYELGQFTISELEFNIVRYYFPYKKLSVERACDEK